MCADDQLELDLGVLEGVYDAIVAESRENATEGGWVRNLHAKLRDRGFSAYHIRRAIDQLQRADRLARQGERAQTMWRPVAKEETEGGKPEGAPEVEQLVGKRTSSMTAPSDEELIDRLNEMIGRLEGKEAEVRESLSQTGEELAKAEKARASAIEELSRASEAKLAATTVRDHLVAIEEARRTAYAILGLSG